jgi:predicted helicase
VRAVDDILKTEFNLKDGLADTAKTKIKIDQQGKKVEQEVHKVQILDPATGTGTFLAEVVKHIYKKFERTARHLEQLCRATSDTAIKWF